MTDERPPHILIVDDHTLICDGVRRSVSRRLPGSVCVFAASSAVALAAVERQDWSAVVLDLGLPDDDGEMGTLRQLRALRPALPILVFSMFPEEKVGVAALDAGASGYLCKTADRDTIGEAVASLLTTGRYVSATLAAARAATDRRKGGLGALSPREVDVLVAFAHGESNKEISARLKVGVTTVGTYRTRILDKLHLRTTADLLRFAVEHRLLRR